MSNNPQCFHNEADDVFKDGNGRILTVGDMILCKGGPFIVLEDGSIDYYTRGKMNQVYYTKDEELGALEEKADELQAERSTGLVTRLWQTDSGRQRQTHRNLIAGIDTPVTTIDSSKSTHNTGSPTTLEGSYNQGKGVTDCIPDQVNNPQMKSIHIGTQVPTYVINDEAPHDNTIQDPFKAAQLGNDPHNNKQFQVIAPGGSKPHTSLDKIVHVVKMHKQVLGDLNEFMVTEFRTLFTKKCIDLTVIVMPLVREFNQVCQVFANNINTRYGYELEPHFLIPEEVENWAKQFSIPIAEASVDGNHRYQPKMDSWGATKQPAGLFPPQQPQAQPQAEHFS